MLRIKLAYPLFLWSFSFEFQSILCSWLLSEVFVYDIDVHFRMKTEGASSCTSCNTLLVHPVESKERRIFFQIGVKVELHWDLHSIQYITFCYITLHYVVLHHFTLHYVT